MPRQSLNLKHLMWVILLVEGTANLICLKSSQNENPYHATILLGSSSVRVSVSVGRFQIALISPKSHLHHNCVHSWVRTCTCLAVPGCSSTWRSRGRLTSLLGICNSMATWPNSLFRVVYMSLMFKPNRSLTSMAILFEISLRGITCVRDLAEWRVA